MLCAKNYLSFDTIQGIQYSYAPTQNCRVLNGSLKDIDVPCYVTLNLRKLFFMIPLNLKKRKSLSYRKHQSWVLYLSVVSIFFISSCSKVDSFKQINNISASDESKLISKKTNVILILGDDVGYEIPTINGGQSYSTPNIDRMAQNGMRFTQVRTSPLCSPSRFMLMTGKYNFRNYTNWGIMDTSNRTLGNLFKDAGYKTFICGKWQLGGGDTSLRAFGFNDYWIWSPYTAEGDEKVDGKGGRYKDPNIYHEARFLPDSVTRGKYGDDIYTEKILNFIDSNTTTPFFIYYPICLVHPEFCPTPDDPEFPAYQSKPAKSDTAFYPSMVKYMDKKIGEIITKVNAAGIANNTVIIFVGDNGTSSQIYSMFNGSLFRGGKASTKEAGLHVPMTILWPGTIAPGSTNDDIIDLTDFMPTLAGIANTSVPTSYGIMDGVSFYPRLRGLPGTPRTSSYCYYYPNPVKFPGAYKIWASDKTYKYYSLSNQFYNFVLDPHEDSPIRNKNMTPEDKQVNSNFQNLINSLHN